MTASAAVLGEDSLDGGEGSDRLFGGPDGDTLTGATGGDRLGGGFGADSLFGGEGDDVLIAKAPDELVDTLDCAGGNDVAYIYDEDTTLNCEQVRVVSGGSDATA